MLCVRQLVQELVLITAWVPGFLEVAQLQLILLFVTFQICCTFHNMSNRPSEHNLLSENRPFSHKSNLPLQSIEYTAKKYLTGSARIPYVSVSPIFIIYIYAMGEIIKIKPIKL